MDDQLQSHPSMPLLWRVDRMDSFMKYIAGITKLSRWSSHRKNRECVPLDVAALKAHSKGSLLDRIQSLEDRLIQLSLENESRSASCTSSASTSSGAREPISSYPIFNNPNPNPKCNQQSSQLHINSCEFQRKSQRLQQKQPTLEKKKFGNSRDEKTSKNGKKGMPPSWPHLRLLGC